MPRARINADGEEVVLPKLKTRKPRVVDASGEIKVMRKRAAPRLRTVPVESESVLVSRKAPTPLAAKRRSRSQKSKTLIIVLGLCVVLSGAGVGIGFMDSGSIDVVAVVNERNEKINKGEIRDEAGQVVTQTLQVQNADTRPNGGLKLGDAPAPTTPVPEVATSTESISTSTGISTSTKSASSTLDVETDSSELGL